MERIGKNDNPFHLENNVDHGQHVYTTYGEIKQTSVTNLLNSLDIQPNDVIYDLGSGRGWVCTQTFLETDAKKVSGIEISTERMNLAHKYRDRLQKAFPIKFNGRSLEYIRGDMTKQDISDATIIYTCSTCFSDEMLRIMVDKATRSNKLRHFVTLKELNEMPRGLTKHRTIDIPCTWSNSVTAHIYSA